MIQAFQVVLVVKQQQQQQQTNKQKTCLPMQEM